MHYAQNKEHYQTYFNKYRANNPEKRLLETAKHRAKKKGMVFNLTVNDIVIPKICPVLGIELETNKNRLDNSPTLDRIDNNKGYDKNNVIVVSWRANRLKADATVDEMKMLATFYDKLES